MEKGFILFLTAFFFVLNANAVEVWNYRVEKNRVIKSGKIKIFETDRSETYRTTRFKYKLDTAIGFQQDWVAYNIPHNVFDPTFLFSLPLEEVKTLAQVPHAWEKGSLEIDFKRSGADSYLLTTHNFQLRFFTGVERATPWKRIEVQVKMGSRLVQLNGNLIEVSQE